ncbi:MAG TPA: PadR family transcriptional regulator [Terriglobales bacterium]|nr:PadR family transcriptional regulator [Terriglobales bacterium]
MKKKDVLQGTLDLLVLKSLASRGPAHGYAIAAHIGRISDMLLRVEEGSLYPALHRMEQAGLIRSSWRQSESGRRARVYEIRAAGRKRLALEETQWSRLVTGITAVLADRG